LLLELIPRNYRLRTLPDAFLDWANQVKASYEKSDKVDPEGSAMEHIRNVELEKLRVRVAANSSINARKSTLMAWSFYFTMIAVILNLCTLAGLALF
jgi:hypothetical protein